MEKIRIQDSEAFRFLGEETKLPLLHLQDRILLRLEKLGFIKDSLISNISNLQFYANQYVGGYKGLMAKMFFKDELSYEAYSVAGGVRLEGVKSLTLDANNKLIKELDSENIKVDCTDWNDNESYFKDNDFLIETENYHLSVGLEITSRRYVDSGDYETAPDSEITGVGIIISDIIIYRNSTAVLFKDDKQFNKLKNAIIANLSIEH